MQLRAGTGELRRGARVSLRHSSAIIPRDKMCVRPADLIADYQIRRGCGRMCNPGAGDFHDGFPTGRHYRRQRVIGRSSRCDQEELPRLARPKGCCDECDIKSFCEQSGRTTGRLGSTGLRAMPSEGRHSRHSGASIADNAPGLPSPETDTTFVDNCNKLA
jgi:hypothetical protein